MTIPYAVLALMADFSKAFNRQNHNLLITILIDMGVPGWLLEIENQIEKVCQEEAPREQD